MGKNGQNLHFHEIDHCYSEFFCQSHSIQSELGQIYSLRALETDTRAITGQKQAKNGLKWPKLTFLSKKSKLFGIFLQISLNSVRTGSTVLIESFGHRYRGRKRPKTGQKWA